VTEAELENYLDAAVAGLPRWVNETRSILISSPPSDWRPKLCLSTHDVVRNRRDTVVVGNVSLQFVNGSATDF
jgi:hypothetical protein